MTFLHELWDSTERLANAITLANWGIAASLLFGFLFTTFVIIAGNRKDELQEIVSKAQDLRIAEAQQHAAEATATAKGFESRIVESDARVKAAEAQVASAKAQSDEAVAKVAAADARSAEASVKAEGFRLDIAKANERAAEANRIAEQERLARLQLEARLADRVVTTQQQARIVAGLRSIGKRTADITIFGDTPEISIFSSAVLECFTKAEWSLNISRPGGGGAYARGVLIGVKAGSPPEYTQASNLVITVLRESVGNGVGPWEYDKLTGGGIFSANSSVGTPTSAGESPLRIVIGSK